MNNAQKISALRLATVLAGMLVVTTANLQAQNGPRPTLSIPVPPTATEAAANIPAIMERGLKSLVFVEYTIRNDNNSREEVGQGIVLSKDGVVIIPGALIPESLPREWMKDLKIRTLGRLYPAVPARFLGRTANRMFAYVQVEPAKDAAPATSPATQAVAAFDTPPLDLSDATTTEIGREVVAVARYDKTGGYEPYVGISKIRAVLHFTHEAMLGQSFGFTKANSPVFDTATGKLVGITLPPIPETMLLSMGDKGSSRIMLKDEEQSGLFLPWSEVKEAFTNVPHEPFEARRPWIGIDETTGLNEDLRMLYNIKQLGGVTVGSVIPGMPAEAAGVQSRDIILTVDGESFSNSPVPDIMVAHFQRAMEKTKIGQEITLGILRDGKTHVDIKVKIGESPRTGSEYPQIAHPKLGLTTHDLAFNDTYSRKLPADQKGVMISLVKQGAPAALGQTPLKSGYLITRVNDQEVRDQKQFDELLEAATADPEAKEIVFRVIRPDGETQVCRIDLTK